MKRLLACLVLAAVGALPAAPVGAHMNASAVAFMPLGARCMGGLASGDSVDGTYSPQATITDVAPVMLVVAGIGKRDGYVPLGWIYTTPRGRYFQFVGSGALGWYSGGRSTVLPIVSFDGDFAKALHATLVSRGLPDKQLPALLASINNGTAKYSYHSCYHP